MTEPDCPKTRVLQTLEDDSQDLIDLCLAIGNLPDYSGHERASYHRAECLTHVGDSQAVRSLTQCGEPMRFAMAAPIDLRNDFDSVSLRRLAKRTRDATQSRSSAGVGRGLRWVAAGRMRRGSAASVCRSFATGCCAFNARGTGRAGRWEVTGRTLEAQRRSPPRTGGGC